MDNGLSKKERICSVKAIESLIAGGKYMNLGVLRCCWRPRGEDELDGLNRIMVSVPKKLFKRAVKRNLLKRRIREAYRLQKHAIDDASVDMMFIYNSKEVSDFSAIYAAVGSALERISKAMRA